MIVYKSENHKQLFHFQAKPIIDSGDIKGLLDPELEGKYDEVQLQRMVMAASLCITRAARLRPKLNQVIPNHTQVVMFLMKITFSIEV